MSNSWHKVRRPAKQSLLSPKESDSRGDVTEQTMPASESGRKRQPLMAVKQNSIRQPPRLQRPKPLDLKQSVLSVTKEKERDKACEKSQENRITSPTYDQTYMTVIPEKRSRPQQDGSILTTVGAKSVRQSVQRKAMVDEPQKKSSRQIQNSKSAELPDAEVATSKVATSKLTIGRDCTIQDQAGNTCQVRRKIRETQHSGDFEVKVASKHDEIRPHHDEEAILPHMKCSSSKTSCAAAEGVTATPRDTSATYGEFGIPRDLCLTKEDASSTGDGHLKKLKGELKRHEVQEGHLQGRQLQERHLQERQLQERQPQERQLQSKQTANNIAHELLQDEAPSPFSSPTRPVVGSVESSYLLSSSPSIDEPPTSSTDLLSPDVQYEVHTIYPNPTGKTLTEKLGIGTYMLRT
jgi:hypothetical protein